MSIVTRTATANDEYLIRWPTPMTG